MEVQTGRTIWAWSGSATLNFKQVAPLSGLVHHDAKIYASFTDGFLIALNAATGQEVWFTTVTDANGAPSAGALRLMDGKLIVSIGSSENAPGSTVAYEPATGRLAWRR
jgi:outer membrane protein assembly factor BamB